MVKKDAKCIEEHAILRFGIRLNNKVSGAERSWQREYLADKAPFDHEVKEFWRAEDIVVEESKPVPALGE